MLTAFRAGWAADGASLRDRFGWWWDGQARIERGDAEGPVQSVQLAIRGSVAR